MTFARGRLISYINIYHLFADPAVYHTFSLQFFGRLELRIWRWNMIDSEMEMKEQKSLVILTTKDRWSELPTYVTDYVQPEESSRWKSINTHTHTHTHTHTRTNRPIPKSKVLLVTTLFFWKICFSLKTSDKKLI